MGPFLESKYSSRLKDVEEDDDDDDDVVEATCNNVDFVEVVVAANLAGVNAETTHTGKVVEDEVIAAQRTAALMMREERVIVIIVW